MSEDLRQRVRELHMAFNVAIRREGGTAPACDGPDCVICSDIERECASLLDGEGLPAEDLDAECHCGLTPEGALVFGTRCPNIQHRARSGAQWRQSYVEQFQSAGGTQETEPLSERCQDCSFDPMSMSDYCEKHRPKRTRND